MDGKFGAGETTRRHFDVVAEKMVANETWRGAAEQRPGPAAT